MKTHSALVSVVAAACAALTPTLHADISGFGDYSTDWNFQRLDSAPPFAPSGNGIQLSTSTGGDQRRNYYNLHPQDVTRFVASFTYRAGATNALQSLDSGLSFVLFTNAASSNGTPSGGNGGSWGLVFPNNNPANQNRLNPSVALVLGLPPTSSPNSSGAGFYTNGSVGGSLPSTGMVNLGADHPIDVTVRYNQVGDLPNFLYLTLSDPLSGAVYAPSPTFLPVASTLGASTAFVGFTTFSRGSEQVITNFQFNAVPAPAGAAVLGLGVLAAFRRRR
ncbi:MAG: hypothetical protein AB7K52_07215 [Phycisphaerales bacterium]